MLLLTPKLVLTFTFWKQAQSIEASNRSQNGLSQFAVDKLISVISPEVTKSQPI